MNRHRHPTRARPKHRMNARDAPDRARPRGRRLGFGVVPDGRARVVVYATRHARTRCVRRSRARSIGERIARANAGPNPRAIDPRARRPRRCRHRWPPLVVLAGRVDPCTRVLARRAVASCASTRVRVYVPVFARSHAVRTSRVARSGRREWS